MANINTRWRRFLLVGCTHGHLVDKAAARKVFAFKKAWNPHTTGHLGDLVDTAAFRSGAAASKDAYEPIEPDRFAARDFLLEYEPNVITWGNHDWRLWEMAEHPNAILSMAASTVRDELIRIAKKLKAETRDYNIETGWYQKADMGWGHGYMYNLNSIADHARKIGFKKTIFAHLHRTGSESADQRGGHRAWCTGYLGDRTKFSYAHRRPGFFRWNHGLIYGEENGVDSVVWMAEAPREGEWRLPR